MITDAADTELTLQLPILILFRLFFNILYLLQIMVDKGNGWLLIENIGKILINSSY